MTEYNYDHLDKLEWANHHIQAFDDTVRVLKESGPCKAVVKLDHKAGKYVMRLAQTKNLYLNPSMIVGDALYNLRSSLDTVTYAVVEGFCIDHLITLTKGQRQMIQFPIADASEDFRSEWSKRLSFLPDEARTVFESLQPYVRFNSAPEDDPLSILKHLSNIDRHRQILVTVIGVNIGSVVFDDGGIPDGSTATTYRGSLKDGAIIDSWPVALGRNYRKVNVNSGLPVHIELGDGTRVAGGDVQRILWAIRNTIQNSVFVPLENLFGI